MADQEARPCGLYRTTAPLQEHPGAVNAGALVYFHNHSDQGHAIVLLPDTNQANRWSFHSKGYSVLDAAYIASLEPLKREGFYRLREHFHPDDSRIVATNALVQLGYNGQADPIIFFPAPGDTDNALLFPTQGMKIPASVYELLDPLDTRGPQKPKRLH